MAAVKAKSPAKSKGPATKATKKAPVKATGKGKSQAAKKSVAKPKPKAGAVKAAPKKKAAPAKVVKKAAPKKAAPKKVAPAKVVKKAPVKAVSKPAAKKPAAPAKKVAAKSAPVVVKKAVVKPTVVVKKTVAKPAPVPTKKVADKPAAKSVAKPIPAPVEKTKPVAKVAAKPSEKPLSPKAAAPAKPAQEIKPVAPKAAAATKQEQGKKAPAKPVVEKADDKLDPLHVKAAKAIKEMEETMDLSRMRPRIQAGTKPAPKPAPRVQAPPLKLYEPTNTSKVKFQLEFEFRASPKILYNYLSDSSGLAGWFADEVRSNKEGLYTFVWEGSESYAKLIGAKELHLVRFQWSDETDGTYFQFEIKEDDITADVALIITDFANPGERDTNIRLWESQVQKLRMLLGSF